MHAKKLDKLATGVLYTIASIIVAILASLILYILVRGLPHVSWSFLTGKSSSYQAGGGIGIQLYNSFFLLVITLIISVPLSMGAGVYLSEYAKKGPVTNFVRTCIEILSSLPSVVVGLFGYLIFVVQFEYGFSIISGALALTVFNLPQMTRNVEDSLRHVHHTQREAGLALGISRWETVLHVVIPEALPSIVTGIVLLRLWTGPTGIFSALPVLSLSSVRLRPWPSISGRSTARVQFLMERLFLQVQQQCS